MFYRSASRDELPDEAAADNHPDAAAPTLFLWDGGKQSGPFNLFQVQQMLAAGIVPAEAQYWSEGMTEWRSVAELSV